MGGGQLRVDRGGVRGRRAGGQDRRGPRAPPAEVRERLPLLRTVVVIDPDGVPGDAGAIPLDEIRARGRAADRSELDRRRAAVSPEDPFTFIYTSGTTGPPKGCVLTHGNYRDVLDMVQSAGITAEHDVTYLFLPLAHSFALLVQLGSYTRARRSPTSAAT